ncbi:SPOR domain-containing protein [Lacihabitans sp. CS3-21]|uniref:HU domain-containing protein n=1 Tax=Lacihabitans sp. CS3-21 TaxID=2487332 RepID=UPI0020CBCA8A|nr:SPOR domain-containing protein [Lacihabitans sp. CS3-21]MCP9748364.1 SPOR domain-containing protein [Lacihabitans sp. CS3-21]
MFNIQREIVNIVLEQDFVVLPGIGAFLTEYSKPFFDKDGEIVLPEKKIAFNHLIDRDLDNKLLGLISLKVNLPKELLKTDYNEFLNKFRSDIVLYQKFEIENLGLFFKNENHELEFYQEKSKQSQKVDSTKSEEVFIKAIKPISAKPVEVLENEDSANPTRTKSYLKVLLYLVPVFLITSTLAYTIFIKPLKNKSEKKNMVEEIDSLTELQSEVFNDSNLQVDKVEKRNSENSSERKASIKNQSPRDSSSNSHIVGIGIFKVKENVDNLAAYLAENGIPARVRKSGDRYKLFVMANSEEQAIEFVRKIEQLTGEKAVYENN